jgi:hypothetical protein
MATEIEWWLLCWRYIVGWERSVGIVMRMRAADTQHVVILCTSLETLLPLNVLEDLEIHAQDGRVLRHVADDGDGTFE